MKHAKVGFLKPAFVLLFGSVWSGSAVPHSVKVLRYL